MKTLMPIYLVIIFAWNIFAGDCGDHFLSPFQEKVKDIMYHPDAYEIVKNPNESTSLTYIIKEISSNKFIGLYKPKGGEPEFIDRIAIEEIYPIKRGSGYYREAAASWVRTYLKLKKYPEVSIIETNWLDGSIMEWKSGYDNYYDFWERHYQTYPGEGVEDLNYLLDEKGIKQIQEMAIFDVIIGNWDRNLKNFLINHEKDILGIDHAMSFPVATRTEKGKINLGWNRGVHAESTLTHELVSLIKELDLNDFIMGLQKNFPLLESDAINLLKQRVLIMKALVKKEENLTLKKLAGVMRFQAMYWERYLANKI